MFDPKPEITDIHDRDDLKLLAKEAHPLVAAMFQMHPNLLVNLTGSMGMAAADADVIRGAFKEYEMDLIAGRANKPIPEHDDLDKAIRDAIEATELAFDTVISALLVANGTLKNCMCRRCVNRRQAAAAGSN